MDPAPDSRGRPVKSIASRRIFGMLWDRHLSHQASERVNFYHLFQASSFTAVSAGWLFEFQMHTLLRWNQTL